MNKPKKFDDFIYAILEEARRYSLIEVMKYWDIDEKELNECLDWLDELQKIKEVNNEII